METITFEQLPKVIADLYNKVEGIEKILQQKSNDIQQKEDNLFTIQQAAEFICLSVPTIYGLVSKSEIPVSKKGKRLYFSKQELTEWIKAGRKRTNSEIATEANSYIKSKVK